MDVGTCTSPTVCSHKVECSTSRPSVDRGQSMNITFENKSTSTPKIKLCEQCHELGPLFTRQEHLPCSSATKNCQDLIPPRCEIIKDLEEFLFKADRQDCEQKLAPTKSENSCKTIKTATKCTQDLIPPRCEIIKDMEEVLLKGDRRHCEQNLAPTKSENCCKTIKTATKCTQDLIPPRCEIIKDMEEVLLKADRRHCEQNLAPTKSENCCKTTNTATKCTQDSIPPRCMNIEDKEETLLKTNCRHFENKPSVPKSKCLSGPQIIQCKPRTSCTSKNVNDLIPMQCITIEDEEIVFKANCRHCKTEHALPKSKCLTGPQIIQCKPGTSCATKKEKDSVPMRFITLKDIDEILLNADSRCCGNKPSQPKSENCCKTTETDTKGLQDYILPRCIEDIKEIILNAVGELGKNKHAPSKQECSSVSRSTQALIPPRCMTSEDKEILLNADRRRCGNKPALPKSENCCKTATKCRQDLIPLRCATTEDIQEMLLDAEHRRCGNKFGRCASAPWNEPKHSSLHSLTSKRISPRVSFIDDTRDSFGCSSDANSPSGSCSTARAQYYHNKLLATIQILQNKEETVKIQAESLTVAETRIAALTTKTTELKKDIDRKNREIKSLQDIIENTKCANAKTTKNCCDASIITDFHEADKQENIIKTLQNNLGIIEELYTECFYETAKQESIIEMLRKSYLDVRLVEREKSDQITRLNNVINTQKWSLDRCQDMASEVDNLKIEITNFLNNSNNDSGVWEESADGVMEDLRDINTQLLHLRELLTGDCTCGLKEENRRLTQTNEHLQKQVNDLHKKINDLEKTLKNKETTDRQFEQQILKKESEICFIKQRLAMLESATEECCTSCVASAKKLHETEVLLKQKCAELCQSQNKCRHYEEALITIRNECQKYEQCNNEICSLREENKQLMKATRSLKSRLLDAQSHAASLEECCRQESIRAQELESELSEAAVRGAALCDAAKRCVRTVKTWATLLRDKHQQQTELLQQKEYQLRCLRHLLEQRRCDSNVTRVSEFCGCPNSPCVKKKGNDSQIKSGSKTEPARTSNKNRCKDVKVESASEMPSCSKYLTADSFRNVKDRQDYAGCTSASDVEYSSMATPQPLWKKFLNKKELCESSVQRPVRSDSTTCSCDLPRRRAADVAPRAADGHRRRSTDREIRYCTVHHSIGWSPCEEVLSRVEGAGAALAAAVRRWRRPPPPPHYSG